MGSLAGHVIPGVFFIIYGSWWCFNSMWLHLNDAKKPSKLSGRAASDCVARCTRSHQNIQLSKLSKMSWIPFPIWPRFPLEPILKIIFSSLGMFVEGFLNYSDHLYMFVYHIRKPDGTMNDLGKFYHIILYFGFALSGVVDLYSLCLRIPSPTSTIFLGLSFFVEGMLFFFHTIGRAPFNTMVHLLLVFCIISCFVFTLLRLHSPNNITINLGLGSSILLQGTWLIQIGYFLFGGYLGEEEEVTEKHVMMATACFAWHLFIVSMSVLVFLTLVSIVVNKKYVWRGSDKEDQECHNGGVYRSEEYRKLITIEGLDTKTGDTEMTTMNRTFS